MKVNSYRVGAIALFYILMTLFVGALVVALVVFGADYAGAYIAIALGALYVAALVYASVKYNFFNSLFFSEDGVKSSKRSVEWRNCRACALFKLDRLSASSFKCVLFFYDPGAEQFDEQNCVKAGLFVTAYNVRELSKILERCKCQVILPASSALARNAYVDAINAHNAAFTTEETK